MNPEQCPLIYTCSKVKMTPLIRTLLRCTASEAMQSICNNCVDALNAAKANTEVSSQDSGESTYISPSGRKITVAIGNENDSPSPQRDKTS